MPVLCYGEVLRFFKTLQYFDKITTLTYVIMDNFLSLFLCNFMQLKKRKILEKKVQNQPLSITHITKLVENRPNLICE